VIVEPYRVHHLYALYTESLWPLDPVDELVYQLDTQNLTYTLLTEDKKVVCIVGVSIKWGTSQACVFTLMTNRVESYKLSVIKK
jgi:hypothetical protein